MTRRVFIKLAKMVVDSREEPITPDELANRLADICASENPAFDRGRFLFACGVR